MFHDPVRGTVLLAGGDSGVGARREVWEFRASGWVARQPVGQLPSRAAPAHAFLPQAEGLYLFGGADGSGPRADLWLLRHQTPAQRSAFGTGCTGTAGVLALGSVGWALPHMDRRLHLQLGNLPKQPLVTLVAGLSRTDWNGLTLPFDLTGHLMPGCFLLVAFDLTLPLVPDAKGIASLTIPAIPQLAWVDLHLQAAILDPGANGAGIVVSNGLTLGMRLP